MVIVTHPQTKSQNSPEKATDSVSIDCINNATPVDPSYLMKRALELGTRYTKRKKEIFESHHKTGLELIQLKADCYQAYGEKLGEQEFKRITSIGFNGCEYQVDLLVKVFTWFEGLENDERELVADKAGNWTAINTLKKLVKVPVSMEWFFYLVDLYLEETKKRRNYPTGAEVEKITEALNGKRNIDENSPMSLIDWIGLVNVQCDLADSLDTLYYLEDARKQALQIAQEDGREDVYLSDAIAVLTSRGKKIELSSVAQPKPKKKDSLETELKLEIEKKEQDYQKLETEFQLEIQRRKEAEERAIAAEEQARRDRERLEQLEKLFTLSQPSQTVETVDITPVVASTPQSVKEETADSSNTDKEPIVLASSFKNRDKICVIDKAEYREYFGLTGEITGRGERGLWVKLGDGTRKQFPASALELLPPQAPESTAEKVPSKGRSWQQFEEVLESLFQPSVVPAAG